ncbi:hypothetical protein BH20ACT2_BH20ACT2_12490 [soil metagenome]
MSQSPEETMTTDETTVLGTMPTTTNPGRRRFLQMGGVAVAGGLVLAACGDDDDDDDAGPADTGDDDTTTTEGEDGEASGDAAVAMTAASLELLAVNTYTAALDAATAGDLGEVPPAVAEFVGTALGHHQEYLDTWNSVLGDAGPVTETPPELQATVDEEFGAVTDVIGAATLARLLARTAADTYLAVIPTLTETASIETAASIQYVTQQRVALLNYVLGEYPVPDVFQTTDNAFTG